MAPPAQTWRARRLAVALSVIVVLGSLVTILVYATWSDAQRARLVADRGFLAGTVALHFGRG